jgi:glucose-6-phosphate isomerase
MTQTKAKTLLCNWKSFSQTFFDYPEVGFSLDLSTSGVSPMRLKKLGPQLGKALKAMARLEAGEIANQDENRMVGHYWLRDSRLAPEAEIGDAVDSTILGVKQFARDVHSGRLSSPQGYRFDTLISVGIGGSALGPQLVDRALGSVTQPMDIYFLDNTDPQGVDDLIDLLGPEQLATTMVLITSKSGGTPETLNGMLEMENAFEEAGHAFSGHAVAITGDGSQLYQKASDEGWIATFPMEDWVGGRTSVTSAVGLVPAALCGVDVDEFLRGAKHMDSLTRLDDPLENPASLLAAAWYILGEGEGSKAMVVLPYKDRLELFSRYLQQLVMESLGKSKDRNGKLVEQGLSVFGNKGSTDQHAYVQQLRDGLRNFFVTFITVDEVRVGAPFEVEDGVRTGDFLNAFFLGTKYALAEEGRPSLTISLAQVSPYHLAALIALFERAVGIYAELINVNAYHQPGVEAGKKAAASSLDLQKEILSVLESDSRTFTACELAKLIGATEKSDLVYHLARFLSNTGRAKMNGHGPDAKFRALLT